MSGKGQDVVPQPGMFQCIDISGHGCWRVAHCGVDWPLLRSQWSRLKGNAHTTLHEAHPRKFPVGNVWRDDQVGMMSNCFWWRISCEGVSGVTPSGNPGTTLVLAACLFLNPYGGTDRKVAYSLCLCECRRVAGGSKCHAVCCGHRAAGG